MNHELVEEYRFFLRWIEEYLTDPPEYITKEVIIFHVLSKIKKMKEIEKKDNVIRKDISECPERMFRATEL